MPGSQPQPQGGKADGRPLPTYQLLLSGAVAGMVGKSVTAPVDRVRILYQVNPSRTFTLVRAAKTLRTIFKNTGVRGLWRGNLLAQSRVVPHSALVFMTFERYQTFLRERVLHRSADVSSRFVAGAAAGVTATTLTYPMDLIRARTTAHWGTFPKYHGFVSAFRSIVAEEGPRALFSGLGPTVFGIIPYAGLSFATFETLKSHFHRHLPETVDQTLPAVYTLIAGGTAGLVAQTATYPLHVVRRRMQVNPDIAKQRMLAVLAEIYHKEGMPGLFKGLSLTWLKGPFSMAITFTLNDTIKSRLYTMHARAAGEEDDTFHTPVEPVPESVAPASAQLSTVESLIAGGLAGAVAKTIIAPGDRIKILYQVNPERKFTLRRAFRTGVMTVRKHGYRGLWRGNGATMLRVIPYSATSYLSFPYYERLLQRASAQDKNVVSRFFCGAAAGATATTLTYPLDLVRARMAAHWHAEPRYPNYATAFSDITKTEGLTALFSGIRPTLLGIMPYAGLSFATFETLKAYLKRRWGLSSDREISASVRLACGGAAGLVAQSATYPLDIVRRRLQVHDNATNSPLSRSTWSALMYIYETEGPLKGLYKGLSMNWIKGPIAVAVSFTVNDFLKSKFSEAHNHQPVSAAHYGGGDTGR